MSDKFQISKMIQGWRLVREKEPERKEEADNAIRELEAQYADAPAASVEPGKFTPVDPKY